jgi:hypothetical protein
VEAIRRRGRPESDRPAVRAALDQLGPLASEALVTRFAATMTKAVKVAFGKELGRRTRSHDRPAPEPQAPGSHRFALHR